jgi:acyl-CoA synthetase (NDP forming)/ribonuclease HI
MDIFFNPKSVAIVGASRNPMKFGSIILGNLFNLGYKGKIFPVNPKGEDIAGQKTYISVDRIPEDVELAILAIPASVTLGAMKDCARKGVKGVVIISSGFNESGEVGVRYQRTLIDIAKKAGIRIVGPNTTGILNPYDKFTTTFVPLMKVRKGPVAFVAQTGMFAGMLMEWILSSERFGISKVAGLGNKCDVDDADALEYLARDKHTKVIMMYIESVKDGRRFMQAAREVTPRKPVLALKSGRTPEGATAAMSHTGSLAGDDAIVSGALRQAGVIRVDSAQQMIDRAKMLAYQPVARGNRLAIVSLSGGAAVMSADAAKAAGLELARFSRASLGDIQKHYPPWATVRHPFDIEPLTETIGFQPAFEMTVRCALANPQTDACLLVTWTPFREIGFSFEFVRDLQGEFPGKPIAFCSIGYKQNYKHLFKQLEDLGIPVYPDFNRGIDSLAASIEYGKYLQAIGGEERADKPKRESKKSFSRKKATASDAKSNSASENTGPPQEDLRVRANFDGASKGNPGPAAIGVVIVDSSSRVTLREIGETIGRNTNNFAEYTAMIRALEEALTLGAAEVECVSDSELVVRQMKGVYQVKSDSLQPLWHKAKELSRRFSRFSIRHVPRLENRQADKLASQALKKALKKH